MKARVKGYEWALFQERHSNYNDTLSWRAFSEACLKDTHLANAIPGDEAVIELWQSWETGAFDARVFLRDDAMLSVVDIAERTTLSERYIQAEIKAKRLKAMKIGNSYAVYPDDFREWLNNPQRGKRGARSKKTE